MTDLLVHDCSVDSIGRNDLKDDRKFTCTACGRVGEMFRFGTPGPFCDEECTVTYLHHRWQERMFGGILRYHDRD